MRYFYLIKHFIYVFAKDIRNKISIKRPLKDKIKNMKTIPKKNDELRINNNFQITKERLDNFYIKSPLFEFIKKNKIEIFNNLLKIMDEYDFKLKIGIEIEFYAINQPPNSIKEMGNGQYEIQMLPYKDLNELVRDFNKIKESDADFSAKPHENDCPSALQINLSLERDGKNLFARGEDENSLILNCIAGLLKNINNNLLLYIKDEKCLNRYNIDFNKKIHSMGKYPAPTFISWGINNRTAAIRIPTPKDFKNYKKIDELERRIEFRVPSSDADIYLVLIGVISSIIEGIENNLEPIDKTSFNILEKNENLTLIETDINKLNSLFRINEN
ncbi:MAG: hypothetical protein LBH46_02495, partial [Rickettsiales bacterium]|nr:hypothetical protein [Rickettsiales bacterium]